MFSFMLFICLALVAVVFCRHVLSLYLSLQKQVETWKACHSCALLPLSPILLPLPRMSFIYCSDVIRQPHSLSILTYQWKTTSLANSATRVNSIYIGVSNNTQADVAKAITSACISSILRTMLLEPWCEAISNNWDWLWLLLIDEIMWDHLINYD